MSGVILEGKQPEYVTREEIEAFGVEIAQNIAELYRRTEVIAGNLMRLVGALSEQGIIGVDQGGLPEEPEADIDPRDEFTPCGSDE